MSKTQIYKVTNGPNSMKTKSRNTIYAMRNRNTISTAVLFALCCLALSPAPKAFGVTPAPDGGYPGYNTAEGQNALFSRTTGVYNTALGAFTLYSDTTGSGNTAVGINGLRSNVNGGFNTAVGLNALFKNNGDPTVGQASNNCAFGSSALFNNSTGSNNCAFGSGALYSNTSGVYNTAIGNSTLLSNAGSDNTAVGSDALNANGDGIQNSAVGSLALLSNSSGNFNTATGYQALFRNDTGSANTAFGVNALLHNDSGGANTALGYGAGADVTTGSFNVYIGANIGGVADEVGHTYISNISSTVQPPGGDVEYVTVNLNTKLLGHSSSSRRYKQDIKPMTDVSEGLYRLKPVTYRYKKEIDPKQSAAYGLIAEEVAEVNPALVARNSKGQPESVHYDQVNAMLLNEFLKEHKTVQELKYEAAKQEEQIRSLTSALQKINAQIETSRSITKITSIIHET